MAEVSDFVTIETAANEAVADLIRQRLDEGGIPWMLVPGNTIAVAGAGAATRLPSRTTAPTRPGNS
jgi:hypothetical protein